MQTTYTLASVPRSVVDLDNFDPCGNFTDEPSQVGDYEQNTQMNNVYAPATYSYQASEIVDYLQTIPAINPEPAHMRPRVVSQLTPSSSHPQNINAQWNNSSLLTSTASSSYSPIYPGPLSSSHSFSPYPLTHTSPDGRRSRSSEVMTSPYTNPSHLSPPQTPSLPMTMDGPRPNVDGHREQLKLFKEALILPLSFTAGPFVPQKMYMPNTNSDRRRYVEEIDLQRPIYFWMESPDECGISLIDALHSRVRRLRQRDEPVFEGRGPSISVRIQWPGYRPWSRQIPTKDFRSPPQPITKAKLAKNIAKCVERFLSARTGTPLEDDVDPRWKVGLRNHEIKLEDLYLVSMHHVSMGSWQPHLRLRRPLPQCPGLCPSL
ncbi:hypothetical protein H2248_010841 [Termitomyces sp. 'cryptogamus']|nr:hypothetical protein H2248_010841 [Termitomyces sp. 'cryptogamus']